jgi:3-mercaptopyruvate sulfurtransferase SseA
MDELDKRSREIPKGQEVVLYCTCPNEASSAMTAVNLRKYGVTKVRPLQGGFHTWRGLGFPVESEFGPVPATARTTCSLYDVWGESFCIRIGM